MTYQETYNKLVEIISESGLNMHELAGLTHALSMDMNVHFQDNIRMSIMRQAQQAAQEQADQAEMLEEKDQNLVIGGTD